MHLQALDFLENRGDLDHDTRSNLAVTTLRRLLGSPDVRTKLGLEWSDQELKALGDERLVASALLYVVNDIANGNIKVGDVYTSEQRSAYAHSLPANIAPSIIRAKGSGVPLQSGGRSPQPNQTTKQPRSKIIKPRAQLLPSDCILNITEPRVREIEQELRKMKLESFPNAVSVLFRVFLELSADCYIERLGLPTPIESRLGTKLLDVTQHLVAHKKLTVQQAKPVRRAAQTDSYLAPSITIMNQYVHNQYMFPSPTDLRASWDNLQPWFIAIWSI